MRYRVEWQLGGEIAIDTGDSDWTHDEVTLAVVQALEASVDEVIDRVADDLEECDTDGEGTSTSQIVML